MDIANLLTKYYPERQWTLYGETYENLNFIDGGPVITEYELAEKDTLYKAELAATEYQRKREKEYPKIDDLIVALWESVVEDRPEYAQDLQQKRSKVKEKYPKPNL